MAVKNHVSLIATDVTGAALSTEINAKSISWITNFDPANAILFNFEETTDTSGAFKLGSGATITNLDIPVSTIHYTSTGATGAAFSLFGIAQ